MQAADNELLGRSEFHRLFDWLTALGLVKRDTVDEQAYWTYLRDLPIEAIRQAFLRCPAEHPRFFPSASELRVIANVEARRMRTSSPGESIADEPQPELALDNPYRALAEAWTQESARLQLDPDRPAPREVCERRMRELFELMDREPLVGDL